MNALLFNVTMRNSTLINIISYNSTGNVSANSFIGDSSNITNMITDTIIVNLYINMTNGTITDANIILTDFLGSAAERVAIAYIQDIIGTDSIQFNITLRIKYGCSKK